MFCTYFSDTPITNWDEASQADTQRYARFFGAMLERGVYLAPSQFEAGFMSLAHTDEIIEQTINAARDVFATLPDGSE